MKHWITLGLIPLSVCVAFAQKKPVTVDALTRADAGEDAMGNPLAWSPDGKSFVYRQGTRLMIFDVAGASSKEILDTAALTAAAVKPPTNSDAPFGWQNRRVRDSTVQWGADNQL